MQFTRRHLSITGATLALALVATAITLWPYATQAEAANAPGAAVPVLAVDAVQAQARDWPVELNASGGIFAWQGASVASEVSGPRIEALLVDVGSVVRKGQLLARLASDSLGAQLRAQQASVAEARAKLAQAEAEAERARQLKDNGTLSEQKVLDYQVSAQTAKAALDVALATLDSQRIQFEDTRIVAPDDGVISTRSASLGQVVSTGTELFQLVRQQRLEWRAELSGRQLAPLRAGQRAVLHLPNGQPVEARLRLVAPTLDASSRIGLAYFDLPADAMKTGAAAGLYVPGEIHTGAARANVLPSSAITLRDGNSYLFEIGAEARVQQRQVQTGQRLGDLVQVLDALPAGARFVNGGGGFLKDGDVVAVRTAAAARAEAAAPAGSAP
ncbi:MAG TPA: efflux RND transporter periplasmic adaptor subunit [Ideonella sp.]|uniref:efflux RND transporter periplasmic adaptor subunit n=1 Tax=Ideonella sp. TaxID=1929293 RepID=UPI002B98554D|nr:efflux RND transporter periplasmic adaptor subunit [Ideonella sp.]HSI50254.1 efflux RND transporter periplasmic adaptor subunit [Ideonella sp.]